MDLFLLYLVNVLEDLQTEKDSQINNENIWITKTKYEKLITFLIHMFKENLHIMLKFHRIVTLKFVQ